MLNKTTIFKLNGLGYSCVVPKHRNCKDLKNQKVLMIQSENGYNIYSYILYKTGMVKFANNSRIGKNKNYLGGHKLIHCSKPFNIESMAEAVIKHINNR